MTTREPAAGIRDGVLHAVVSDPAKGGSLAVPVMAEVVELLNRESGADSSLRAIVLAGSGRVFCNGGDVAAFAAADDPEQFVGDLAGEFHSFIRAITSARVPVIAAVESWAAGAGMSIACAADVIVGGPSTSFVPAYPAIGLSPDGAMTWTLPRIVGLGRARDIIMTNRVIRGEEARDIGLITRFVDDDRIYTVAEELASELSVGSKYSAAAIKRLLVDGQGSSLDEQLDREARSIGALAGSPDGREGVAAFVARRKPTFTP